MGIATKELEDIKNSSDKMAPEDRVARTMDLQEDIAAKVEVIKKNAETELALLPQGEKVPQDAQDHKNELNYKVYHGLARQGEEGVRCFLRGCQVLGRV